MNILWQNQQVIWCVHRYNDPMSLLTPSNSIIQAWRHGVHESSRVQTATSVNCLHWHPTIRSFRFDDMESVSFHMISFHIQTNSVSSRSKPRRRNTYTIRTNHTFHTFKPSHTHTHTLLPADIRKCHHFVEKEIMLSQNPAWDFSRFQCCSVLLKDSAICLSCQATGHSLPEPNHTDRRQWLDDIG